MANNNGSKRTGSTGRRGGNAQRPKADPAQAGVRSTDVADSQEAARAMAAAQALQRNVDQAAAQQSAAQGIRTSVKKDGEKDKSGEQAPKAPRIRGEAQGEQQSGRIYGAKEGQSGRIYGSSGQQAKEDATGKQADATTEDEDEEGKKSGVLKKVGTAAAIGGAIFVGGTALIAHETRKPIKKLSRGIEGGLERLLMQNEGAFAKGFADAYDREPGDD